MIMNYRISKIKVKMKSSFELLPNPFSIVRKVRKTSKKGIINRGVFLMLWECNILFA